MHTGSRVGSHFSFPLHQCSTRPSPQAARRDAMLPKYVPRTTHRFLSCYPTCLPCLSVRAVVQVQSKFQTRCYYALMPHPLGTVCYIAVKQGALRLTASGTGSPSSAIRPHLPSHCMGGQSPRLADLLQPGGTRNRAGLELRSALEDGLGIVLLARHELFGQQQRAVSLVDRGEIAAPFSP